MKKEDPLINEFMNRTGIKITVLLVDDNIGSRKTLKSLLCSPLMEIVEATSLQNAKTVASNRRTWHCWIVDIELGDGSGLELLKLYPNFPFKVVISGLHSMTIAAEATRCGGAYRAFDKDDPLLFQKYCYHLYDLAALGFLLKGQCQNRQDIFFSLIENPSFETVDHWATGNNVVIRTLEQTCRLYAGISPAKFMKLFRSLSYVLGQSGIDQNRNHYEKIAFELIARRSLESVLHEWDEYLPVLNSGSRNQNQS